MTTTLIRQIIARSGLDAYNEEISAACDAIDAQMQGRGEAVAEVFALDSLGTPGRPFHHVKLHKALPTGTKLYTHPAADLTDEQIRDVFKDVDVKRKTEGKTALFEMLKGSVLCGDYLEAITEASRAIIAKVKGGE